MDREAELLAHMETKIREQERAAVEAEREAAKQERYARSPEGLREAAAKLREQRQARERDLADARELISARGDLPGEVIEQMAPNELLHSAGLVYDPSVASREERDAQVERIARDPDEGYAVMTDAERISWSRALGFENVENFDSYAAEFNPGMRRTFASPDAGAESGGSDGE